jgi:MFS transporter, DHA1 family, multidrug resistance protein
MLLVPLWFVIGSVGCIMPNTPALALTRHGESAGTAAAMLGAAQFVIGGLAAPLVGAFGDGSAVPMGAVMTGALLLAGILMLTGVRDGATEPESVPLPA